MGKWKKIIALVIILIRVGAFTMSLVGILYILDGTGIVDIGVLKDVDSEGVVKDASVKEVMTLSDEEVWKSLTGGLLSDIPDSEEPSNAKSIEEMVKNQIVNITIPTRAWEDPEDHVNMNIVEKDVTIEVNSLLAGLWKNFFTDLYNEADDFVIESVGGFRIDGTGEGQKGFRSAHTYGAGVDINANYNPYGTKSGSNPYSKKAWQEMEENHYKYMVVYQGSKVIDIAHRYTLLWGGEWTGDERNPMHFSFICDGLTRKDRIKKYGN